MQTFWKIIGVFLLFLILLAAVCLKPLDATPYQQTEFYKKQVEVIEKLSFKTDTADSILLCGWSRVNLTPPFTTPIAIDADRGGKHWSEVHDSIFVAAFVFKNAQVKAAYVSCDLLIVPPLVLPVVDSLLKKEGFSQQNIFYTATHSHSSIGGWHPTLVGEIFAGKFDQRVINHIAYCISKSIIDASSNMKQAAVSHSEIAAPEFVFNRLVGDKGCVDDKIRMLTIIREDSSKGMIATYAAHATCLHKGTMELSGDWPSALKDSVEKKIPNLFFCFSAGAVGSMGPVEKHSEKWKQVDFMANGVAEKIVADTTISVKLESKNLGMWHMPLHLREPSLRVNDFLVVRPWLFYRFFGKEETYINMLQIGNISFCGTPCDFSGELNNEISKSFSGKNIVITSFNGSYIGYVTMPKWYTLNAYETRTMGWFGHDTGTYLLDIIVRYINKSNPLIAYFTQENIYLKSFKHNICKQFPNYHEKINT
jgi:hypothetical protein